MLHVSSFRMSYVFRQEQLLFPFIAGKKVLDFGCGNMTLTKALAGRGFLTTGVDVVEPVKKPAGATFVRYGGVKLPFGGKSFDTTIAYHVFHHTQDPLAAFIESGRVTRKRILFVEPVYRSRLELPLMRLFDRMGNGWRAEDIPMPYQFRSQREWIELVAKAGWKVVRVLPAGVLPGFLPIGKTLLFIAEPKP